MFDCVLDTDPDPDQTASNLIALLRRWSGEWLCVLAKQFKANSDALAKNLLPVQLPAALGDRWRAAELPITRLAARSS